MKSSGYLNNAKGAVAPLVAIMLVLLILCVAVVVDLGHIHNVKIQLQRAVDAAALAGAHKLPDDEEDGAKQAAVAVAAANFVDSEAVVIDPSEVILGVWDKEALGDSADERFDAGKLKQGEAYNAVKVTASRQVDHVFFFFAGSTEVTADAIAVSKFEEETIPIALVSCIPTGGDNLNIASPGLSICDITTYRFHSDTDDTAAWTSLTFNPASKSNIEQFLTEEGRFLFNEIVYGNDTHNGIENTEVETGTRVIGVPDEPEYGNMERGCIGNNGTSIVCGLGENISVGMDTIEEIQEVDSSKLEPSSPPPQDDPLAYKPLPRWYHFDKSGTFAFNFTKDAFTRVWTQDGHLPPPPLGFGDQDHLKELYETDGITNSPYGTAGNPDFRFKKFIKEQGGTYKPDYNEVLRYAGYPPVWVNNGTISDVLATFLERIADKKTNPHGSFFNSLSTENEPFETGNESNSGGRGYTVELTLPVIFAGDCEEWKAISNGPEKSDNKLFYVGTANFLLTRAWQNPNCFEQGDTPLQVTHWVHSDYDGTCESSNFDPSLAAGDVFECSGGPGSNPNAALEGLIRPPTRGKESETGVRRIYLVE